MKYILIGDDMFYRTLEGLLLKCLGPTEVNHVLHEVHEGACGTYQLAHKMKWLIRRSRYYWATMLEDSFKYYKGCQACQRFRKIQMIPMSVMNPIIKPWPFRGWGMDMIGKINPPSSKGHQYILAIMYYFTKWVEAITMKSDFIKQHVIHRMLSILSKSMLFTSLGFLRPSRPMEDRSSYLRNSGSSLLTWGSS
jgi:hypothetical protein